MSSGAAFGVGRRGGRGPALAAGCLAAASLGMAIAAAPAARACGYHDGASASLGMLNWAFPDSLHVRTAVWTAQLDGVLARVEPTPAADPQSPTFRFQQTMRYRATQDRLEALRSRLDAASDGPPMPAFSIVLLGPMLWTRFERDSTVLAMQPHTSGPAPDDVVVVTDEPVLVALAEGRLTPRAARESGLVRYYGTDEKVRLVSTQIERLAAPGQGQLSQVHQINEER